MKRFYGVFVCAAALGSIAAAPSILRIAGATSPPTPVGHEDVVQETFKAGNVTGPVGYVDNTAGQAPSGAGTGKVWATYGHYVSGTQCPLKDDSKEPVNKLWLKFTRDNTNTSGYYVTRKVTMDGKERHRRTQDLNDPECHDGPPTWTPTSWIKATEAIAVYGAEDCTDCHTEGSTADDSGGSFVPPSVPHGTVAPVTTEDGTATSVTVTDAAGNPIVYDPNAVNSPYASYLSHTTPSATTHWYSPDAPGIPNPDPHADQRTAVLTVMTTVKTHLDSSAREIIVIKDTNKATVTLQVSMYL